MFPHDEYSAAVIRYQQYLREAEETRLVRLATVDQITPGMRIFLWISDCLISFGENLKHRAAYRPDSMGNMHTPAAVQRMVF